MLFREISPGEFAPWEGEPIDGVCHPLNIELLWSPEELAKLGLYAPAKPDEIGPGKVEVTRSVKRVDGVVKWVVEAQDEPPKPLPPLTPIDFKLGMLTLNVTPDQVDQLIEQMPDPDRMIAKIYWTSALKFERTDPLIEEIATKLGKTQEQIDEAWRYAAGG